ncbi:branched-chain amino acid--2-keto-4-methylthiobutyrate aminotransferase [Falsiroseomonas bella]|uniref:Probable branched-chain-amino-acid aminotransferase n=1 Tax=Falsiroseomonas bella TaxID=2184016 RepID=A0A317F9K2_9PROT|nr:aminotransferase class IV [Falsiroseomonas bella]PWS34639.1 branched-chain amino acid--2-keto-4-methylthiobutyrate aminotransferase [Falsiroseomonas bella]
MAEPLNVPTHLTPENADFSKALAFLDGALVPLHEARVPVRDLGLMYADMTYDVVHTWRGGFFRLEDHLDRFLSSCAGLRLDPGLTRDGLRRVLAELVRRSGLADTLVYFACTRGTAVPGTRDPARHVAHRFFATVTPLILRGQPAEMNRGLHAMIARGIPRIAAASVNPAWKNTHWGDFQRATFLAKDAGADIPLLLAPDGALAEAPGFNLVALVDGGLVAPDANVLPGISCRTMFEIAADLGIPARYGRLAPEDLGRASEAFLTATSCGLFPLTRLDGAPIGAGVTGPVTTRLLNTYYDRKNAGWHITEVASIPPPEMA